ncbi:protein cramped [Anoplophora glabripennis]|uniref:protein cramped n=1 Tax=Anoplophora glabripennis TaxID=217634 RepID=UPI0008740272|nr:protein cramped [Anoplophora glabripennis]
MNKQEMAIVKMEVDTEISEDIKPNVEPSNIEEPLLGSVTTFSNTEGPEIKSQQLRSSARVFKKMKLDLTAPPVIEKCEKKEEIKQDIKKCYRPLWTSDDKNMFFEALNEFGKDFENIQLYISMKLKKKGVPENLIKTKDQVRHLYYRSWHKISKYVKFSEGIKKIAQELYSLINYGELRKKIGSVSEKCLLKLNELIYKGSTMLRIKGKTVRVKTPMCRALRKLNQLDENYDEIRLPNRVTVELRPKDMTSFLKVQIMAQNPRIRTILPLQKRLSNLITCVNNRWKTVEARVYDKALVSSNPVTDNCVPPTNISDENKMLLTPTLRLTPPDGCKINVLSINVSEYFTRKSICLHSYEHRIGITNADYIFCNDSNYKLINKNNAKKGYRPRTDSASEKVEKSPQKSTATVEENELCDSTENEQNVENNKVVNELPNVAHTIQPENHETDDETLKIKVEKKEETQNDTVNDQNQELIERIRKGWTEYDSESITLGELYLMFGTDLKLILEYSWEKNATKSETVELECKQENVELNGDISNDDSKKLDLSDSLSKLLSVAKLHYRKNIIKCPCGHVCGTKNNVQLKRAMESKIRKMLTDIDKCTDEAEDKMTTENIFENEQSFVAAPVYIQPNIQLSPATYFHPPNTQMVHLVSQINSIQRLKPRYCNRRGRRPRSKPVVVERKLPLLPNKMESGHQIVRMNIISQESTSTEQINFDTKNVKPENHIFINQDQPLSNPVFPEESHCATDIISKSLSNSDVVLQLANDNNILPSTAPSSPSRILKEDNQWINSEVADYSLSSLLGHLESPIKANASVSNLTNDDSRLSQDVDAQISSLLTESSLDFSANFADLAAQVTNESGK